MGNLHPARQCLHLVYNNTEYQSCHNHHCEQSSSLSFFNVNTWLIRSPLIVCFRATCCLLKSFNRKCQHRTRATSTWKNQRDVNYIWPRSTGTIKQTPGLRWSLPCVKVSHVLCLHYTAGFEIVLQCGVCPGSLFVFDVFIHHTRSNDF